MTRPPLNPTKVNFDSAQPIPAPYLASPPAVVDVNVGRQLFVDDYLIANTTMTRVFHQPVKHPGNPVMFPETDDERPDEYPPCALAKCGGVWYDDRDDRFKMWYMAGYVGWMVYAESDDGIHWERPELDVVPGTNLCLPRDLHPDSGTVWIDKDTGDETTRYKMMLREPNDTVKVPPGMTCANAPGLLMTSPDGIHWSDPITTGPMGDRSTMFHNPFRNAWVQSIRGADPFCGRCRLYFEHGDFIKSGQWIMGEPIPWARADCLDEAGDILPQLYNLDAVAYESLMIGFFQIFKGPPNNVCERAGLPKLTELVATTSRDGFHWHRPDRRAFIGANRVPGSWEYGYVEPSGGVCLIVGDELWFYYSAYGGDLTRKDDEGLRNGMYGNGAIGLAKLRRDGFASMSPRFPEADLTTRPLTFTGDRLFVNANANGGALTVEAIGESGEPIPGCAFEDCVPFRGNATRAEIRWKKDAALSAANGNPVQLRFKMDRGHLYAFWITASPNGESGGHVAAGGPGFKGRRDVV